MKLVIKNYEKVNDFEVIEDKGRVGRYRPGIAKCPFCKLNFECNIYNLKYLKSCGCFNPNPMPELDKFINGFEVLKDYGRVNGNRRVKVKCKICEKEFDGQVQNIKLAKSCGCLKGKEIICKYKNSHKRLLRIYRNMKSRCYNINHKSYYNYGKKGIDICNEWLINPDTFCKWSLENNYNDSLSIDRIDGTKGYSPENCRWITVTEQNRNARTNVMNKDIAKMIRKEDRSIMTVQQIADKYNLARTTVSSVLNYYTWNNI
jgi:hypothetical protein